MQLLLDDDIAALASPPGGGLRGVVRLTGGTVREVVEACFTPDDVDGWKETALPRRFTGWFRAESIRPPIPVAVHLWPTSRSYTGQPAAEIHTAGSQPLLEAMLAALYRRGARPARAGEFTLRAFLAGRIDLVQAEAVLGVIDASEQPQLKQALEQLAGGISGRIAAVHADLLELLAEIEAGLDFIEEDIEFVSAAEIQRRLTAAQSAVDELLERSHNRTASTGSLRVVLAGPPNAGKSTLFNALAGDDAAIVSAAAGTTRDYLRAELEWDGLSIELIDTAGWEANGSDVAGEAQRRREDQLDRADLVVQCSPADGEASHSEAFPFGFPHSSPHARSSHTATLSIVTKADLARPTDNARSEVDVRPAVSAATGEGLERLRAEIVERLTGDVRDAGGLLGTTAARCRGSLDAAAAALSNAVESLQAGVGDDLVAAEVRDGLNHLGEIVGAVYTDDVLDRVFSKFCIGK